MDLFGVNRSLYLANYGTNHQDRGEIGYQTIFDLALKWYMGLYMVLISIFEAAKSSLYGIIRYSFVKIEFKVKPY